MKRACLALALASAVLLSACSLPGNGANGPKSQGASTTTTVPWMWPPKSSNVVADVSAATDISLQTTDLPAGWNAPNLNPTTSPADNVLDEAFVQCMFGPSPSQLTAYVVSPVFASQDGSTIAQSFVRIVPTTAAARADFSSFNPARATACETAMYTRQFSFAPNTKIIGKKFGFDPPDSIPSQTILPPDGSSNVIAIRYFVSPRDAPPTYVDVFAYGVGRVEAVVIFQSGTANPSADAEIQAITNMKARVNASNHG